MHHLSHKKIVVFGLLLCFSVQNFSFVGSLQKYIKRSEKEDLSWYEIQKKSEHAVVQVFSQVVEPDVVKPYRMESEEGRGSGFLIDASGFILTNYHVIAGAIRVVVQMPLLFGKRMIEVEIKSVCPDRDLALLALSEEDCACIKDMHSYVPFLPLGDSDKIEGSAELFSLVFPLGQEALKSSTGVVSGIEHITISNDFGRHVEARCIQVSIPINPGNSGGPTLNRKGEVVAINTAGIESAQNIGYALPISEFKLIQQDMLKHDFIKKPYLGAHFCYAESDELAHYFGNPVPSGCYLTQVYKYGLFYELGLQAGDMIYSVNGYAVDAYGCVCILESEDRMSASDYISSLPLGTDLILEIYRQGEKIIIKGDVYCPQEPPVAWKYFPYDQVNYEIFGGILLQELSLNIVGFFRDPQVAQHLPGVADELSSYLVDEAQREKSALIVTQVFATSGAHKTRAIAIGDSIIEINGQKVSCLQEARKALEISKNKKFTTLKTQQDNFIVLDTEQMLQDEKRLSELFNYPITPFMQELLLL